jgi:hypothetical protein
MKHTAVPFFLAAAVLTSACSYEPDTYVETLSVPTVGRTVASVSQDAGLSLTAGAAPGTVAGFFYDWPRRDYEQQVQAAQRRERLRQVQAGAVP